MNFATCEFDILNMSHKIGTEIVEVGPVQCIGAVGKSELNLGLEVSQVSRNLRLEVHETLLSLRQ